ncbi:MAG: DUF4143 domain-containing protein [Proteobacteria bacterium]|nr:DUF4143 domain-containing protein [Pseudomonadota bacterium]
MGLNFKYLEQIESCTCKLHRFNQWKKSNIYFYRDSKGNEVDLLLKSGSDIFPVEIKAGMTITRDYFKGLNHFAKVFSEHIPKGAGIVYSGSESQKRTNVTIVPFKRMIDLFRIVEE